MIKTKQIFRTLYILSALLLLTACATKEQPITVSPLELAIVHQNKQLTHAKNALAQQQPRQTLQILNTPPNTTLDKKMVAEHYHLRADAYDMLGNHIESARELILRESSLVLAEKKDNHTRIWGQLSQLSNGALAYLNTAAPPDILSGWMDLLHITRRHLDEAQLEIQLDDWKQRYPQHPANLNMLDHFKKQAQLKTQHLVKNIALLLPFKGKYAANADNIRNGFIAALLAQDATTRPNLRIYDSSGEPHLIHSVYQTAIDEGAEFIIGPLRKNTIKELARNTDLSIPVLALNQIDTYPTPENLYQFALNPEDEAWQAAERARLAGHKKALALVPKGAWGDRILQAFSEHWQGIGGELLEIQRYNRGDVDFSQPIQALLDLDQSKQRQRQLQRILANKLQFEPRRRQDADFIFLLANADQARLIRPQLRFHRASNLPIYATSHVYTGQPNAKLDQDLNGIRFCDIPWTLPSTESDALTIELKTLWPQGMRHYRRLIALGIDSYRILPYLPELSHANYYSYNGLTGILYLDKQRRVHRNLTWAGFQQGKPQLLPNIIANTDII